jgi:hypothetical protein
MQHEEFVQPIENQLDHTSLLFLNRRSLLPQSEKLVPNGSLCQDRPLPSRAINFCRRRTLQHEMNKEEVLVIPSQSISKLPDLSNPDALGFGGAEGVAKHDNGAAY